MKIDTKDLGEMRAVATAALGIFPRIQIDPAHVIALLDEIERLTLGICTGKSCGGEDGEFCSAACEHASGARLAFAEVDRLRADLTESRAMKGVDAWADAIRAKAEAAGLRDQLAAVTTARDEAVNWLMEVVGPSVEAERHIAELRKVGAK